MNPLNPPVWVESTAVGRPEHSIPAAEMMGSATVREHLPTHEMSCTASILSWFMRRLTIEGVNEHDGSVPLYGVWIWSGSMDRTDTHLEASLDGLNSRVNELESAGDPAELMEAYVNRGSILSMLGYRTSALDDLESAAVIAAELPPDSVDAGTFIKIHTAIASMIMEQGGDPLDEYLLAATRLDELHPGSSHFDKRSAVRMCSASAEDLMDCENPEYAMRYLDKGLEIASGTDPWSENRCLDMLIQYAESADMMNDVRGSIDRCSTAIEVGSELMEKGLLEDVEQLVSALVLRASGESDLGMNENTVIDLNAAVGILEGMLENHSLPDADVLMSLHHDLAGALMKTGRIEEAEKHLIRAMEIGIGHTASSFDD